MHLPPLPRTLPRLAIAITALLPCACGSQGNSGPVSVGTSAGGGSGADAGSIGDSTTSDGGADAGPAEEGSTGLVDGDSGGMTDATGGGASSGGSSSGGGSSGGIADGAGSSGGIADGGRSGDGGGGSGGGGSSSGGGSSGGADAGGDAGWPSGPEDDIKGVPAGQATYKSCAAAWECGVKLCSDTKLPGSCMDPCLMASSEEVVSELHDFVKCFVHICHEKQCKSGDTKCLNDCIWSRCGGFAVKCNAGKVSGGKDCMTGFQCLDTCKGAATIGCMTACYQSLSTSAQHDFDALWQCVATSDSADPFADCVEPALACASAGTTGKNSCLELAVCDAQCKPDAKGEKFGCTAKCYGQSTATAQKQWLALTLCVLAAQKGADTSACGDAIADCAGASADGTSGALGCKDMGGCEAECKKKAGGSDPACSMQCLGKATRSAAKAWWSLAMCYGGCGQECKGSSDDICTQICVGKKCTKQLKTCQAN